MTTSDKVISKTDLEYKGEKHSLFKWLRFSRKQLCIPYALFLAMFVVFPLMLIVFYAFTSNVDESFTIENFVKFFNNWNYVQNLLVSILIGLASTVGCLLIGYPVAYILSKIKSHRRTILLLLFIMPMWINFVLRAIAMKELLDLVGLLGKYNYLNTVIGMIYDYLPFMILPLYTTLIKIDDSYAEAASDLGSSKVGVFFKVTVPLSLPGILSGVTMVFLPSMTCYVISDTYGYGKVSIIGKLIETCFGTGDNWHLGSAMALIMLVIMLVATLASGGFGKKQEGKVSEL